MVYQKQGRSKPSKPAAVKCTPLPISQHGNQARAAITVPLTVEFDADLIEAISAIPNSERLKTVRDALRLGLQLTNPDSGLRGWLEGQLTGLHEYLERKFAGIGVVVEYPISAEISPKTGKMTAEQRQKRLKNAEKDEY